MYQQRAKCNNRNIDIKLKEIVDMKVVSNHVIIDSRGKIGRFEELEDGNFIYLYHKYQPIYIEKEYFEECEKEKKLPPLSSLS